MSRDRCERCPELTHLSAHPGKAQPTSRVAVLPRRIGHLSARIRRQELDTMARPRRMFVVGMVALAAAIVGLPAALGNRATSAAPAPTFTYATMSDGVKIALVVT